MVLTSKGLQFVVEFEDTSHSGWFIRACQAMMTKVSLFKETKGVVVEMVDHAFDLSSFKLMSFNQTVRKFVATPNKMLRPHSTTCNT